jgi:hypothetical protein
MSVLGFLRQDLRLALNLGSCCLCLLSAGITGSVLPHLAPGITLTDIWSCLLLSKEGPWMNYKFCNRQAYFPLDYR